MVNILVSPIINSSYAESELYKTLVERATPSKERLFRLLENGTRAEFLKCNKTILVGSAYHLETLYLNWTSEVNQERYSIYVASDEIGESGVGWRLENRNWDMGVLTGRLSNIVSSGIQKRWEDLRRLKYATSSKNFEKRRDLSEYPRKLALSTNIFTIFVIHFVFLSITAFVFVCENYKIIFKTLKSAWRKLVMI